MTHIKVDNIKAEKQSVLITFTPSKDLKRYFKAPYEFWYECSESIEGVPYGIAVVPFVANVLPIAWLTGAKIELKELDADFHASIPEFQQGFKDMYPMMELKKSNFISTRYTMDYPPPLHTPVNSETLSSENEAGSACVGALFSGGVDAFATMITHLAERPVLVTVWGADIKLSNVAGWKRVQAHANATAKEFGLKNVSFASNFREFINEGALSELVRETGDIWWYGWQHGLALICQTAPLTWIMGMKNLYIASSCTPDERKRGVTCASDPTIDNHIRMNGCHVTHDLFELERQSKVNLIVDHSGSKAVKLRVCWSSDGGTNCCKCEKCVRTMLEIFAAGGDPRDYGFAYTNRDLRDSYMNVWLHFNSEHQGLYYREAQTQLRKHPEIRIPRGLRWIRDIDFDTEQKSMRYLWKSQTFRWRYFCSHNPMSSVPGQLWKVLVRNLSSSDRKQGHLPE